MRERTLIDVLAEHAELRGEHAACTYLEDGHQATWSVTYRELFHQVTATAADLQTRSEKGARALLLYPTGPEFLPAILGCFCAGIIAIPAPAPGASQVRRAAPRLRGIIEDSDASLVLTTAALHAELLALPTPLLDDHKLHWITTDQVSPGSANAWRDPELGRHELAFLQYTSGSTTAPRGVMVGHGNLIDHLGYLQQTCGYLPNSRSVTWMPHFHDYGLIEGLLEPIFNGTQVLFMSPLAFIKRPSRWLAAISHYHATHSQGPNFAYHYCVRRHIAEEATGLDLRCWIAAGIAAEPINPRVMRSFHAIYQPYGFAWEAFCPAYGLAEATLMVSFSPQRKAPEIRRFDLAALEQRRVLESSATDRSTRELVGCGRLFGETHIAIVDPDTCTQCDSHTIGEIWVADKAIAAGYWRRPAETRESFDAYIVPTGEGPYLRTGDLGYLWAGQVYIAGRLKDTMIFHGVNHYPQEIEWTVQVASSQLRHDFGAAFSILVDSEEKLVVAQELEDPIESPQAGEAIVAVIREQIAREHEVDAHAVVLLRRGSLPKTTSGKIQRSACRQAYLEQRFEPIVAWVARTPEAVMNLSATGNPSTSGAHTAAPLAGFAGSSRFGTESQPDRADDGDGSRRRADTVIAWLREYGSTRIHSRLIDERRCIPPYIVLDFGNQGLLGLQVPQRYGGLALGYRDSLRVLEQLAAIDLTIATLVFLHNTNGIRPIQGFATESIREELLPRLAQGRELAAFGLSEPGAGANLGALMTSAVPTADGGWSLTGVKRWNSSAWAGVISIFARTVEPTGRLGGLTGFVVRQGAAGLRVGQEALTMGLRGSMQNALHLDQVHVGPEAVLGQVRGGMNVVDDALRASRLCTAAVSLGAMKRCAQIMNRYASRRLISSGPLLENAVGITRLSVVITRISLIERVVQVIARQLDDSGDCPPELSMIAKVAATNFLNDTAAELMQLLGGRGYMENNLAPQLLRDARALSIGEGPNESLTIHIGRSEAQTQTVSGYLRRAMRASTLADRLQQAAQEIACRCQGLSSFADPSVRRQWEHELLGELSIEGFLVACVNLVEGNAEDRPISRQASAWAQARFESAWNRGVHGNTAELATRTTEEITSVIRDYRGCIGDLDPQASGVDESLDPLLAVSPEEASALPGGTFYANQPLEHSEQSQPEVLAGSPDQLTLEKKREILRSILIANRGKV